MTKREIVEDVKRTIGLDINGANLRDEIQFGLSQISSKFIVLILATGFGKTKIALDSIKGNDVLIVHKQITHKQTWKDEIVKWDKQHFNVDFTTYNSLNKCKTSYDTIILDETHGVTPLRLDALSKISYSKLICLSATVPDDKLKQLYRLGKPKIVRIPIIKSIKWGVTPIPKIKVIDYKLNNSTRNQIYVRGVDKTKKTLLIDYPERFSHFGDKKHNLNIKCSEKEHYDMVCNDVEYWKTQYFKFREDYQKNNWLRNGSKRKRYLNHLKNQVAKTVITKLKDKRIIVFTTDIAQCEKLGGRRKGIIHSKNKESLNLVNKFNSKQINSLFAINMLSESMNLVDLDCALMVNLDGSDIMAIQKLGRACRSKTPIIYVIRILNTRDMDYFNKLKDNLDDSYFQTINLDDI